MGVKARYFFLLLITAGELRSDTELGFLNSDLDWSTVGVGLPVRGRETHYDRSSSA